MLLHLVHLDLHIIIFDLNSHINLEMVPNITFILIDLPLILRIRDLLPLPSTFLIILHFHINQDLHAGADVAYDFR